MTGASASVVVAGAGGLGREIADAVVLHSKSGGIVFAGFVDDGATEPIDGLGDVLGPITPETLATHGFQVILGIGDPETRLRLAQRLGEATEYATVIHPTASVSPLASVGHGVFVGPFAYVGPHARVDDHSVLNIYSSVGHDAVVERGAVLSPYATLNGHAVIGTGVLLGSSAVVSVGVQVGAWSRVATAGAVMADCEPGSLVAGNPAKSRVLFRPPTIDVQ